MHFANAFLVGSLTLFSTLGMAEPVIPPSPIVAAAMPSCALPLPGYSAGERSAKQLERIQTLFNDSSRAVGDVRADVIGWRSGRCYRTDSPEVDGAVLVGENRGAVAILIDRDPAAFDSGQPRVRRAVQDYLYAVELEILYSSATSLKQRLTARDGSASPRDSIVREVACGPSRFFLMHFLMTTMDRPSEGPSFWCYFNSWEIP